MLRTLAALVEQNTRDLENYEYARALQRTDGLCWRQASLR
jgi:hypothetical protein